jgi:hypothetical protein
MSGRGDPSYCGRSADGFCSLIAGECSDLVKYGGVHRPGFIADRRSLSLVIRTSTQSAGRTGHWPRRCRRIRRG